MIDHIFVFSGKTGELSVTLIFSKITTTTMINYFSFY